MRAIFIVHVWRVQLVWSVWVFNLITITHYLIFMESFPGFIFFAASCGFSDKTRFCQKSKQRWRHRLRDERRRLKGRGIHWGEDLQLTINAVHQLRFWLAHTLNQEAPWDCQSNSYPMLTLLFAPQRTMGSQEGFHVILKLAKLSHKPFYQEHSASHSCHPLQNILTWYFKPIKTQNETVSL